MRKLNEVVLSKNFRLSEFVVTATGLENIPDNEAIKNLELLVVKVLQPLRDFLGHPIIVTSGYRSRAVNNLIPGSSLRSQHLIGQAADIKVKGFTNEQIISAINKIALPFDQLINEKRVWGSLRRSEWVHVSYNEWGNRYQMLEIFK